MQKDMFQARLPPGLRERLANNALLSGRSMNAEFVLALEHWVSRPMGDRTEEEIRKYASIIDESVERLRELLDESRELKRQIADNELELARIGGSQEPPP